MYLVLEPGRERAAAPRVPLALYTRMLYQSKAKRIKALTMHGGKDKEKGRHRPENPARCRLVEESGMAEEVRRYGDETRTVCWSPSTPPAPYMGKFRWTGDGFRSRVEPMFGSW